MGLLGNLTAGEIVEQLVYARRLTGIRNVVFMGMGEPLDNYDAVAVRSARLLAPGWLSCCVKQRCSGSV